MGQTHKESVSPEISNIIKAVGLVQNKYNPNLWHDPGSMAAYHTTFVLWAANRKVV